MHIAAGIRSAVRMLVLAALVAAVAALVWLLVAGGAYRPKLAPGKLDLLDLLERARRRPGFDLRQFHADLLALGSPPLGLMDAALAG